MTVHTHYISSACDIHCESQTRTKHKEFSAAGSVATGLPFPSVCPHRRSRPRRGRGRALRYHPSLVYPCHNQRPSLPPSSRPPPPSPPPRLRLFLLATVFVVVDARPQGDDVVRLSLQHCYHRHCRRPRAVVLLSSSGRHVALAMRIVSHSRRLYVCGQRVLCVRPTGAALIVVVAARRCVRDLLPSDASCEEGT